MWVIHDTTLDFWSVVLGVPFRYVAYVRKVAWCEVVWVVLHEQVVLYQEIQVTGRCFLSEVEVVQLFKLRVSYNWRLRLGENVDYSVAQITRNYRRFHLFLTRIYLGTTLGILNSVLFYVTTAHLLLCKYVEARTDNLPPCLGFHISGLSQLLMESILKTLILRMYRLLLSRFPEQYCVTTQHLHCIGYFKFLEMI